VADPVAVWHRRPILASPVVQSAYRVLISLFVRISALADWLAVRWRPFRLRDIAANPDGIWQSKSLQLTAGLALLLMIVQSSVYGPIHNPVTPGGIVDLQLAWSSHNAGIILMAWQSPDRYQLQMAMLGVIVNTLLSWLYVPLLVGLCYWIAHNIDGTDPRLARIRWLGRTIGSLQILGGFFNILQNVVVMVILLIGVSAPPIILTIAAALASILAITKLGFLLVGWLFIGLALPLTTYFAAFFTTVRLLGFSLCVAIGAPLLLLAPSQGVEILRVLAEDIAYNRWGQVLLFYGATFYLAYNTWYWARFLIVKKLLNDRRTVPIHERNRTPGARAAESWTHKFLPKLCAKLPIGLMALAFWKASLPVAVDRSVDAIAQPARLGWQATFILYLFAIVLVVVLLLLNKLWQANIVVSRKDYAYGFLMSALVLALSLGLYGDRSIQMLTDLGPGAVVMLASALFVPIGSFLVFAHMRTRVNILGILAIWALVCASNDWGDNHDVHVLPAGSRKPAVLFNRKGFEGDQAALKSVGSGGNLFNGEIVPAEIGTHAPIGPIETGAALDEHAMLIDLNDGFTDWLRNRADRKEVLDADGYPEPYPVIFVAAEGGGIRAAYQAAALLSAIQDAYPNFAQHTFMISGVSGGSLGAAVFSSLARLYATNEDQPRKPANAMKWVDRVDGSLGSDLLSPPLAGALSGDLFQRFVPHPIPIADRARALETSLEFAWRHSQGDRGSDASKLMGASLYDINRDFTTAAAPALFFNSTCVETGDRIVVSTMWPRSYRQPRVIRGINAEGDGFVNLLPGINGLQCYFGIAENPRLRLSTASVMSARFPVISSSAGVTHRKIAAYDIKNLFTNTMQTAIAPIKVKRRYVDGGYFENSGLSTVNDTLIALGAYDYTFQAEGRPAWYPIIITISFEDGRVDPAKYPEWITETAERLTKKTPTELLPQPEDLPPNNRTFPAAAQREPFDELSPLFAYANLWNSHGRIAQQRMRTNLLYLAQTRGYAVLVPVPFHTNGAELPLGWLLSRTARNNLKGQATVEQRKRIDKIGQLLNGAFPAQ